MAEHEQVPGPGGLGGEAFNLDHILRLVSEGGHATSQDKILEFSKEHKGGGNYCHLDAMQVKGVASTPLGWKHPS